MLAEGSFLSPHVPFFSHLSPSPSRRLNPPSFLLSSLLHFYLFAYWSILSNSPHLPDLSVLSTPSFMSLSSPEMALPIMTKRAMTAWTSAEEWTVLRGFFFAEIQREQQNNKQTWPWAGPVWILKVVKYEVNVCCSQNDIILKWTW